MTLFAESASQPKKQDSLGCSLDKLSDDQNIRTGDMTLYRKASTEGAPGQVILPAADRGFLIGLSSQAGHTRRIFHEHHATETEFHRNSLYIRRFTDDYKADLSGSFDFILLEISHPALERLAEDTDISKTSELQCVTGRQDNILGGLLSAMFSPTGGNFSHSALFIDQLSTAIGIHLVETYGNGRQVRITSGQTLTSSQASRAKDMLQSRLDGSLLIEELADSCGLSRAAFIRAFRSTTGKTPHQWLMAQRIERAKDMLVKSRISLAEIAMQCGFSDQSHFSRAFSSAVGVPPAAWRRKQLF